MAIEPNKTKTEGMKKIFKSVKLLMRNYFYKDYRLIITNERIELKITPRENHENEINWIVENDKYGRRKLYYSLQELI